MAWELINEPRCRNCAGRLQQWIVEMARFVKSLDSVHLLSTGEEGFYTAGSRGSVEANPEVWALTTGQDFIANHDIPEIDFAVAHLWPDNWYVGERGTGTVTRRTRSCDLIWCIGSWCSSSHTCERARQAYREVRMTVF